MRGWLLRVLMLASLFVSTQAIAGASGSLSVIVFLDGKPLPNAEVVIDDETRLFTDADGWSGMKLPVGQHLVQITARDSVGIALGYARKLVSVAADEDTQVLVALKQNAEAGVIVDAPQVGPAAAPTGEDRNIAEQADGSLHLRVLSDADQSPVKGARVFVKGTEVEGMTDKQGIVVLQVPTKKPLGLSVVHADYSAQTLENIVVAGGQTINKKVMLTPASVELEEFVVLAPHIEGSIASVVQEKREADSVAEILGAEQFSKQGDSSAAGALKRATGLTLVGGRYVFVRGLGDRYSNSRLNEMALPSPNPTQRVVPLDMFPTGVIGSIKVQKTWSPELPANFGGGNIDIRTKDTPEEFFANISLSTTFQQGTTLKEMKQAEGGSSDFLGYDDARGLSGDTKFKVDVDHDVQNFDKDAAQDLMKLPSGIHTVTAIPGFKLSANLGDSYDWGKENTLGYFASYAYSQDWNATTLFTRKASFTPEGVVSAVPDFQDADIFKKTYNHGGLLGLTLDAGDDHKFRLTNFYINVADDAVSEKNSRNDGDAKTFTTSWFQRELLISQLAGEHHFDFGRELEFNWALEAGSANADEPLTKSYTYLKADEVDFYVLNNTKINYQNNEVHDNLTQLQADASLPYQWLSEEESKLNLGFSIQTKDRDAKSRRFALFFQNSGQFQPDELDTSIDSFTMDDFSKVNLSSRPTESYTAQHDVSAFFINTILKPRDDIEIGLGARRENSTQEVTSNERDAETNTLVSDKTLPAANMTYKFNDDMQVRLGYSETVTRPDFREFAKTRFQDPISSDIVFGNEFLTYSEIKHYDLRYEWYINDVDNLTAGLFAKQIVNPIETVVFYTDINPLFTYINARDADLTGFELSWRKGMGFLAERMNEFSFSGNLSLIDSQINIYDDLTGHVDDSLKSVIGELTTKSRPMQGQSSHVLNLQLAYDDKKANAALLYNVIGRRIVNLGTEGFPDMYEEPFNQLDLVGGYKFSDRFKLSLRLKNILDDDVTWKQGDVVVRKYKKGRSIGVKAGYRF